MLLKELKLKDYDKYLAILLAPKAKQQALAALFLFGYEISQIPVEVSEPMIGLIKLQWWQDALDEITNGLPARPHPILKSLITGQIDYVQLNNVIAQYNNLLEGAQPRNFTEIENFLINSDCIILRQAASITDSEYNDDLALSYALSLMARKVILNSQYYTKFASQPELLAKALIEKSAKLLPSSNNIFAVITQFYNKNSQGSRWKLLLKLMFRGTYS